MTEAEETLDSETDRVFVDDEGGAAGAWELSKENVLPLRAGRRLKCLNDAVERDSLSQDSAVREERHGFEAQLRRCVLESTDNVQLLAVWHNYVNWTEQMFPSGKELQEILQRSLQAFPEASGEMALVSNEGHYVDLWLKMAQCKEEPGEIFQFMYSKKIGCNLAHLYEQWAGYLEDAGNTKKASAVLQKGISKEARPIGRLEKLRADLELRVARGLRSGVADMMLDDDDDEQRKTLGDLRGRGKYVLTAPNVRVGPRATISGMRRGIGTDANTANGGPRSSSSTSKSAGASTKRSSSNTPSSSSTTSFHIFSDDNPYRDVISDNKFNANPISATKTKENAQKAVAWNKARAKQKPASILSTPSTPSFDIHVDGDGVEGDVFETPAKTTITMTHAKPLSTKKFGKEPFKALDFLDNRDDTKAEEKFMFCKDKIYQGLEEFSFEEIRFEIWKNNAE